MDDSNDLIASQRTQTQGRAELSLPCAVTSTADAELLLHYAVTSSAVTSTAHKMDVRAWEHGDLCYHAQTPPIVSSNVAFANLTGRCNTQAVRATMGGASHPVGQWVPGLHIWGARMHRSATGTVENACSSMVWHTPPFAEH